MRIPGAARARRLTRAASALPALLALLALGLSGCGPFGGAAASAHGVQVGSSTAPVALSGSATTLQSAVEDVIKAVQPSVVQVQSGTSSNGAIGSGEILTSNGYIVTNDHVVQGFSTFHVLLTSGKDVSATLVGQAPGDDLAVLKISASGLHPIAIGGSSKVQVGQFVVALGSPLGLAQSATFGIISATNRTASEAPNGPAGTLTGLIQTSAEINPGNSGGALVDLSGQLVGIPTLGAVDPQTNGTAPGIGFAIPSDRMKFIAQQLISSGRVTNSGEGFLGIEGEDVTPQLASAYGLTAQSGVLVAGFANDTAGASPSQQAGTKVGDIIIAVNGTSVPDSATLTTILNNETPGTRVTVTVMRGSGKVNLTVTLGQKPENPNG